MQQSYGAPGATSREAQAEARTAPPDTPTLAERLAEDGRSDEEIERLAGMTLSEIIALRADRATRREKRAR